MDRFIFAWTEKLDKAIQWISGHHFLLCSRTQVRFLWTQLSWHRNHNCKNLSIPEDDFLWILIWWHKTSKSKSVSRQGQSVMSVSHNFNTILTKVHVDQIISSFKNITTFNITHISHGCPSSLTPLVPSAFSPCLIGEFGTARKHQEKKNKFKHRKKSRLCPGKHVQELLAAESLSHGCVSS